MAKKGTQKQWKTRVGTHRQNRAVCRAGWQAAVRLLGCGIGVLRAADLSERPGCTCAPTA